MGRVCLSALFVRSMSRIAAGLDSVRVGRGCASGDADVQQRHAAGAAEAMSGMPPAELHRADVVHDLQGYASVSARHRKSRRRQDDAAVVCRSRRGPFQEHETADRRRDRVDQHTGRRMARRKATPRTSLRRCSSRRAGPSGSPTSSSSFRRKCSCPATGVIDQSNLVVRAHFEKDMWVKAAEVRPGNARSCIT